MDYVSNSLGRIYVWNFSHDPSLLTSRESDYARSDPVSCEKAMKEMANVVYLASNDAFLRGSALVVVTRALSEPQFFRYTTSYSKRLVAVWTGQGRTSTDFVESVDRDAIVKIANKYFPEEVNINLYLDKPSAHEIAAALGSEI